MKIPDLVTVNSVVTMVMLTSFSCAVKNNQHSEERLVRVPYTSTLDQQKKDFFLYVPKGYADDPAKKWPVILFLHGHGERGNGKDELGYVLIHGPIYEAWIQRRDLPFLIISPQLPMFGFDTIPNSTLSNRSRDLIPKRLESGVPPRTTTDKMPTMMAGASPIDSLPFVMLPRGWEMVEEDLVNNVRQVLSEYRADADRVYLSGLSYGGFGTWYMASKHPEMFAAINPIVGWGHPDFMEPISRHDLPVWVFSGGRDPVVPKKYFLPGLNKLEELGISELRYTIEEDLGHDTWKRVYAGDDIYNWMLSHTRK
jgi:predicted peptidase